MPGYSQLKKLSEQLLKLGNEINVRAQRGEKAFPYPVPDSIPDIDDSEDFINGMPEKPKTPEEIAAEEEAARAEEEARLAAERAASGIDDIFGSSGFDSLDSIKDKKKKGSPSARSFLEEEDEEEVAAEKEAPPPPKGINGTGYSGFGFDDDGNLEETPDGPDITALMGGPGKRTSISPDSPDSTGFSELDALLSGAEETSAEEPLESAPVSAEPAQEETPTESSDGISLSDPFDLDSLGDFGDLSAFEDTPAEETTAEPEQVVETEPTVETESEPAPESADTGLDFDLPDFPAEETVSSEPETDVTAGMDFDLPDFPAEETTADTTTESFDLPDFPAEETAADTTTESFDLPDFPAEETVAETEAATDSTAGMDFDLPDFPAEETTAESAPAVEETPTEPEAPAPEPEPPQPEPPAPQDDGLDLSDLGIDGIEIEDYTPTTSPTANASIKDEIDVDSIFGSSDDVLPNSAEEKKIKENDKKNLFAPSFEAKSIEDDIAILKPDIFTKNPVTTDNPPFYVTGEFGKLPKTPEQEAEEAAAATSSGSASKEDDGPSGFSDIDFDAIENEPEAPPAPTATAEPTASADDDIKVEEMQSEAPSVESGNAFDADMFNTDMMDGFGSAAPAGDNNDMFSADFDSFSMDGGAGASENATDIDTSGGMPDFGDLGDTTDFSVGDNSFADFNIPETDAQLDAAKSDFELDNDFSIPGFSEVDADPYAVKKGRGGGLDQVDFSGAMPGVEKQRTSLTEEEYKKFKKNLSDYPLNVRIVVEDMIHKNEFTDEVVFELIDKILKKVTARQLAGYLEKMLDITLHVPRDFEKRTAAEYEAYKASFSYQLKARILPAIILSILAAMIVFCVGYLGFRFVVNPLWAEKLYKEGYALLEHDDYPQSESKFDEALTHKPKKKWFYRYAQGYRTHRQYDRAEKFYKAILRRFDHDKPAGLEYARMMLEDLGEYERAEEILKREVLDYHINDPDGILALGDTYLDWATEKDSSKFQDAFDQYSIGAQLYGKNNTDLYQSRFLRYNIRTDQLHNVLELKEFFYPREKSLSANDWTELSGYLLDKLYGDLPRNEEYLRGKIEDLRDMLLFAIKANPANPISNYNLSRYFVEVGDHTKALSSLKNTETLFNNEPNLRKRDIYKQIDNYRLLGEEYLYDHEYILARETLTNGINLFEKKQRFNKFEGDKNVGTMYYDMGNLEYFISGDLPSAQRNYKNAIANKVDTPSVRYRVGYIDYSNNDYTAALGNFLKASELGSTDSHTLLALGNTLSLKNDNYSAQSYYDRLLSYLDFQREKYGIVIPQIDPSAGDMVEIYMKAANNLGVSQFRVSRQSGNSSLNAKSLVNFQNSIRYYDALTRNQETLVRLPGSNLAEQNLKYATNPISDFEPAIYTEIPRVLDGEKGLEQ